MNPDVASERFRAASIAAALGACLVIRGMVGSALVVAVFACATAGRGPAEADESPSENRPAPAEAEPGGGDVAAAGAESPGRAGPAADPAAPALLIGAVLPVSGSPSNRRYTRLLIEGLEVGALLAGREGVSVEIAVEDNLGTASGSARGVDALLVRGALVVIGPLDADNVRAAVGAAPRDLAFFSPTASRLPYGRAGVYSLAAGDPEAGRALAGALWELGYADAVIIHPRSTRESVEMDAFQRAFLSLGGFVGRRIRYSPGETTFEGYLTRAKALAPSVLVVAAPPADLELLAPQIAFFGLDEIELQIAGTAGWTDPLVVEGVERRHTDGVIAVSATPPGVARRAPPEFVRAYEELFRRSLNSMIPTAGFDLLRMALGAYREGARAARDVMATLERMSPFEGVTGTYSFADGRLTRRFHPVRILDGALRPLAADTARIPAIR